MDKNKAVEELKAIEAKQIRGFMLKLLEITHPQPTPSSAISAALVQNGLVVNPDISRYVSYLEDKGYIEVKDVALKSLRIGGVALKLTPKGIDLLEGTIEDPGVDI
ncbi:hypothetical protein [Pelotomaculum propionicicum]|uniref:LexA repressor DNA-binding domain-containing protein n=1 Tax=Pelotomaculum propionicicum TaxID=258475 RepID=A0A4Y7RJI2_9FIRM|nr:hypothetical protein [Pelotomaculum propionicicum]TEB09154.1 hypothetical protein Pmgp_03375 [Pelotomaculum propionicicum]